jgi:hypothetical protein
MSRKIDCLHPDGNPSGQLKRSIAHSLVRRALAVWVVKNVTLQYLAIRETPSNFLSERLPYPSRPYIPEKLPPVDLPGIKFEEPASSPRRWRNHALFACSVSLESEIVSA